MIGFDVGGITRTGTATASLGALADLGNGLFSVPVTVTGDGTIILDIAGGAATDTASNTTGNIWTATRTMQSGDTLGTVAFTIDFEDTISNAGTQVTGTTDNSSVTFSVPTTPSTTQDDIALYRAGVWFISTNLDGTPENSFGFGDSGDTPLVGDFNGDGTDDIALYRAGVWFISTKLAGNPENIIGSGYAGVTPLLGDFIKGVSTR